MDGHEGLLAVLGGRALADEQALGVARKQKPDGAQKYANGDGPQRVRQVAAGEPGGHDGGQRQGQAQQGAGVLEENDGNSGILACEEGFAEGPVAPLCSELAKRDGETDGFTDGGNAEDDEGEQRGGRLVRRHEQLAHAFVHREHPAEKEEHHGNHEGPEVHLGGAA